MKTIGMIGGMSWESSAEYYRVLNTRTRARLGAADGPPLPVTSWTLTPGDMPAIRRTAERIVTAVG